MRYTRPTLLLLFLLVLGFTAEAQRGGRNDGSNRRQNPRASDRGRGGDLSDLKFQDRLWYGAGGTFFFQGNNGTSYATLGLTPQIGYKFNEFLSAGPRFGVTNTFAKDFASFGNGGEIERRRFSLLDLSAGGFVRGRYRSLYIQGEYSVLSQQNAFQGGIRGTVLIDDGTNEVAKARTSVDQLQIGIGYNPSQGTLGSDIGIYYNLFDDVNSVRSAIEFRFMLTFGY